MSEHIFSPMSVFMGKARLWMSFKAVMKYQNPMGALIGNVSFYQYNAPDRYGQ